MHLLHRYTYQIFCGEYNNFCQPLPTYLPCHDGKKNMTAARNSEGVQYRYTYDTKGNPQDVVIHHDRVSTSVMAGRSYYIRHRKSGKYIDVKDASNKDGAAVQQYE